MFPPTSPQLPTSKAFLTSLFSSLPRNAQTSLVTAHPNEAPTLSSAAKPTLLTLHALFPTTLLPALDLLDRHLITRFILSDTSSNSREQRGGDAAEGARVESPRTEASKATFYVKSNAHSSSRSRCRDIADVHYEVRTQAWNCSCAAFAFAAFHSSSPFTLRYGSYGSFHQTNGSAEGDEDMLDMPDASETKQGGSDWKWGGLMLGEEEVPLCKHLLACVLAEWWDVAKAMVEDKEVGREEMAGWAAGWGG
ncbi:hypothetical protein MMC21_003876 [Puttea exsequens]|nr:hypothetical protein [Puttea exsequens]